MFVLLVAKTTILNFRIHLSFLANDAWLNSGLHTVAFLQWANLNLDSNPHKGGELQLHGRVSRFKGKFTAGTEMIHS